MLDEPFSALDSYLRWEMELELKETLKEFPGSTLLVSHSRDEVYRIAQNVCVIDQGTSSRYRRSATCSTARPPRPPPSSLAAKITPAAAHPAARRSVFPTGPDAGLQPGSAGGDHDARRPPPLCPPRAGGRRQCLPLHRPPGHRRRFFHHRDPAALHRAGGRPLPTLESELPKDAWAALHLSPGDRLQVRIAPEHLLLLR